METYVLQDLQNYGVLCFQKNLENSRRLAVEDLFEEISFTVYYYKTGQQISNKNQGQLP